MDNFTGLFGDGDLENLELIGEAYGGPQGPTPVPVSDVGSFSQSTTNQCIPNAPAQVAPPPQKLTMSNAQPGYHYTADAPGQYQNAQYRTPSYPGPEMYPQRQPMQANQNVPVWSGSSDHLQQPTTNYQPSYPLPNSQAYPAAGTVNSNIPPRMPQNYQHIQPQNMNPNYPQGFQGSPRPFSPYEQQRPMAPGSPNVNSYVPTGQPQYGMMQNPRESYHISNYVQGQQAPMGVQSGDVSQFPNSQIPNGSVVVYRPPYPQATAQTAQRPQLSPMPRSMSPHARPNSNLSMTSPVSSPAPLTQTASPNPTIVSGPPTPQQLEGLNPNTADRNTPTNSNTSIQQPLHSPVMYSNVHSPLGQRAPMSPGIGPRHPVPSIAACPRPPISSQQWLQGRTLPHGAYTQQNYGQAGMAANMSRPILQTMPQVHTSSNNITDSIVNISDSPKPNESDVSISNGPMPSAADNSSDSASVNEINTDISSDLKSANGTNDISENSDLVNVIPTVPPNSSHGAPSNFASVSEGPISVSHSSNSHAQPVTGQDSTRTSENGLPHSVHFSAQPVGNLPPGAAMSSNVYGNTMVRYSTPQESLPYSPQGYRYTVPPHSYPQQVPIAPGQRPQLVSQMRPLGPQQIHSPTMHGVNNPAVFTGQMQYVVNKPDDPRNGPNNAPLESSQENATAVINTATVAPSVQDQTDIGPTVDNQFASNDQSNTNVSTNLENLPPVTIGQQINVVPMANEPVHAKSLTGSGPMLISTAGGGVVQVSVMPPGSGAPMQIMGSRPAGPPVIPPHITMHQGQMVPGSQQGTMMMRPIRPPGLPMMGPRGPMMPGAPRPMMPIQGPVPSGVSMEIQQCQQQLQQLYASPQNIQTQQMINDLQQKLSHLQQQQQQHYTQPQALFPQAQTENAPAAAKTTKKKTPSKPKAPKTPKTPKPKIQKETKPKEPRPKKEPKPKITKEPKAPKEPKTPKPKKERQPRPPKEPKLQKSPKEKKSTPAKKTKKKPPITILGPDGQPIQVDTTSGANPSLLDSSLIVTSSTEDSTKTPPVNPVTGQAVPNIVTPEVSKPKSEKKPARVRNATPARKKPSAKLNLNFNKKKKRRGSESDFSDGEITTAVPGELSKEEDEANKRRSGRIQGSRKKYVDELDIDLSDDNAGKDANGDGNPDDAKANLVYVDPNSEDMMAVQFILSTRMGEREVISDSEDEEENKELDLPKKEKNPPRKIEVEEYHVKYKAFSYLHCEWRSEEELLRGDKRIQGKIKRYKQKKLVSQNMMDFLEEEAFNPDYCEVDRLIDITETTDPITSKPTRHFLVKWKSLPYEDCTWEIEDDVDVDKISAFNLFKEVPTKNDLKVKKHPKPDEWKQLDETPIYKNNNKLREYQLEGLNWLTFSYYNSHNCILADEMGLGKTIQSLSFIEAICNYGIRGPFLIIAPLSTIPNWQREFESWTDLNVVVYHGSQISRNMILEYEMYYKDEAGERIPNVHKFHVLITTFEVIIADSVDLKEIQWKCCIIDEAHRLKNRNCKLLEGLRSMTLEHRVLLSGTPLQNNVNELFSLLNFLEPTQFASQEDFLKEFGKLESQDQVSKLQALLKPMMLRRMKEDVEKGLAPKQETIVEVELTNIQKKYYRAILEKNFDFLCKGATYTNVPSLMNAMMELRKCCLHPYLLNGAEESINLNYKETCPQLTQKDDIYNNALIQSSGKMVLVDKLLPRLKRDGHRVLIFSQMVKLLDIIEDYLIFRKYPYERLDGRIRGNLRQAAIDRYCKPDSDRFVFLLCTKAGGLGINLTAADTVIIYDSDWNPQNDLQAQARCHRIGQEKSVKIYRLLCRNTYEKEMFDKASLKLGLDKAVLQSMNTDAKGPAAGGNSLGLSKEDIENLLKKGAYGALMDDDTLGDKFCEEDIDSIMSRRTTVVTLESEKGSKFSKASFSANNTRSDIELDDPEFWKKWAKSAEIDLEAGEKKKQLVLDEPRRRSQIRRYGHDEAIVDCSDLESSGSDTPADVDPGEDMTGDLRLRTRRGRGRGRSSRSSRVSRSTRTSRWNMEEEVLDGENVKYGFWARSECFKVEKGLLTFGWGRWKEIMQNGDFRSTWRLCDITDCARMLLLFCIRYYKGDDKIKGFIFDLIAPTNDGKSRVVHNHIGLSAPVPRGRKGKKKLREAKLIASHMEGADWAKDEKYDTDLFLDQGYSRHLTRHANKVLLRVRLLFYIRQEIIGDLSAQIEDNIPAIELPIHPPPTELPPKPWWEVEADRCLLVGVYKHGYDRYSVMRNDPTLIFYNKCGPPNKAALMAEMVSLVNEAEMEKDDKDEEKEDSDSNQTPASPAVSLATNKSDEDAKSVEKNYMPYPTPSDINGRLRRLVTSYQRNNKKLEMRKEANVRGFDHYLADKLLRRERMAEYIRDRELRKADYNQRRWSNREQAEFYRTISTFGVEYIRKEKRYDWTKFRNLSRLEKRLDENLTEYFRAFMAMCKRQCGIRLSEQENAKIVEVGVDRLPEERARRVLERVDLLNRLRNDILPHSGLQHGLELALPSNDLPEWWIPGKHDLDLIQGVAKHGLGRTDYYIMYDPDLCFREILRRQTAGELLITKKEKEEVHRRFYQDTDKEDDKDVEMKEEPKDDLLTSDSKEEEETEKMDVDEPQTKEKDSEDDKMAVDDDDDTKEITEAECANTENGATEIKKEKVDSNEESNEAAKEMPSDVEPKETAAPVKVKQETTAAVKEEAASVKKVKEESETVKDEKPAAAKDGCVLAQKAPLLSLQQMDEAMAKFDPAVAIDTLSANEPTVAQLLAQSAANPIKWPKDRMLQTRLEHIMYAVEKNCWPVEMDFQSVEVDSSQGGPSKCDTPPSGPSTPNPQDFIYVETERKKRRQMEEVERAHLAMLHPNLHHKLGLSKAQHSAAAAVAALGINLSSLGGANLRSLFEAEDKKHFGDSHAHALKQLQALQGTLDLTVKPVNSAQTLDLSAYIPKRGPGRPRLDESARNPADKRRHCDAPPDQRPDKKRRKLDDIVLGLSTKSGPDYGSPESSGGNRDANPLSLHKGSSVTLHASKDHKAMAGGGSSKLSSSVSITPTGGSGKLHQSELGGATPNSPTKAHHDKELAASKPGLIRNSDLPPGISLPPGIELYRPTDSTKVDKWLEQHHRVLSESQLQETPKAHKETQKKKIDFSTFDWSQFSGDEHVSVISPSTGQKFSGDDAPKLKRLAQWLMDHPTFDVDPQWAADSYKERPSSSGGRHASSERKHSRNNSSSSQASNLSSILNSSKNPFQGLDPKMALAGIDPKLLASLDPKYLAAITASKMPAIDPKQLMAHIDPKQLMAHLDHKQLMTMASLDPKMLAAAGIDPKTLEALRHLDAKPDKKPSPAPSPSAKTPEPKPSTSYGIDPKLLGIDPRLLTGLDSKLLSGLDPKLLGGLDPKMLGGLDPKMLAGLDPKMLAGLDPKILAGLDPKMFSALDPKMLAGLDPKMFAGLDPKMLAGLDPKMFAGLDPKMMAGFDPKMLAGMDPKMLAGLDPKMLAGLDPKMLAGLDPKMLAGLDPKMFAGFDPKMLAGLDPKMMAGFDPKMLAGLDPKMLAGLDPKMFGGIDPKMLGGLDPQLLQLLDPKFQGGMDPKLAADQKSMYMGGLDPKLFASLCGADPKSATGGIDPKVLASMGIDPVMMMAGFGAIPNMGGMGMPNPLLGAMPGFGLAGMPGMSLSKKEQRAQAQGAALAASQANLFGGMLGGAGAAGLMYPHLGLGMGAFGLPQMSSALLNGLSPAVTSVAGTSKSTLSTSSSRKSSSSDRRSESQLVGESSKSGGLSKEERHLLKQKKAERLAKAGELWAQEAKIAHEPSSGRSSVAPSEEPHDEGGKSAEKSS